jgi:cyclic dehypoxanthinyl futalosine synthase
LAAAADALIEDELRRIIRNTGFKPVQRDTLYRTMFLN